MLTLLFLAVAGGAPLLNTSPAAAEDQSLRTPRYFEETGFWVQGSFREYWESHGGLFIFGYPITAGFQDEDGLYKQYFERAIFEYHPDNYGTEYEVLLQRLGAIRTEGRLNEEPFLPLHDIQPDENCDFYTETGHRLCFGFKNYWNQFGGLPNFGFPLSEEFDEQNQPPPAGDGNIYTVQYFERARFEFHPEHQGTPYEVLLGLLGTEYLIANGAPAGTTDRQSPDFPPPDPTAPGMREDVDFRYGFNLAWQSDDQGADYNNKAMAMVTRAGFNAARVQVAWSSLETAPGQYDFRPVERILQVAESYGVRVLLSVVRSPAWATADGGTGIPDDPSHFGWMMEALSRQFAGRIEAYEIWNEQNLAHEAGIPVSVEKYVNLLRSGYYGVKTGDPNALVVFGGLTPNGVNDTSIAIDDVQYMNEIYAYNGGEVRNYYDVLGAHPGSNNNSPDQSWPGNPGEAGWSDHNSFYFRRIADLRAVMVANDEGEKPIWITEFGWTTANQAPGYEYGVDNTPEEQAAFLARAFEIARTEWPWMSGMYVWNLNFSTMVDPADEKYPWSVLNSDWTPRPAYEALSQLPKDW